MAAVNGVPNRAEKAADIPHMVMMRLSLSSRRIHRPTLEEMDPPIWRMAPSRPEEPPTRWVIMVDTNTNGAVRRRRGWFSRTAASTKLVPRSPSMPHTR